MTVIAKPVYVALEPLPVTGKNGETVMLEPGEAISDPEAWGSALHDNVKIGRIGKVMDYTDAEFVAEAKRRGFKITQPKKAA